MESENGKISGLVKFLDFLHHLKYQRKLESNSHFPNNNVFLQGSSPSQNIVHPTAILSSFPWCLSFNCCQQQAFWFSFPVAVFIHFSLLPLVFLSLLQLSPVVSPMHLVSFRSNLFGELSSNATLLLVFVCILSLMSDFFKTS